MLKILITLWAIPLLTAQVTTIPAASGGGGGAITAGRVAFGDGSSTAATDSTFLWDNTNKRFQIGPLPYWASSYTGELKSSIVRKYSTPYASYQDTYGLVSGVEYGDNNTGLSSPDIYANWMYSVIQGNTDAVTSSGGHTALYGYGLVKDSAKAQYTYGVLAQAQAEGSATANFLYGIQAGAILYGTATAQELRAVDVTTNINSTNTPGYVYGVHIGAAKGGTTNFNIYSAHGSGQEAKNYFGGSTSVGVNSVSADATFRVYDGTSTTGSTSVVFDIGAGQSSTSTILTLGGVIKFGGQNTTGAGSASLGSNSPATTNTAPYTWIRAVSSDGSTIYIPGWK